MSGADRGFALFLAVMLVVMATLFYELFPRHDAPQGPAGGEQTAPAATPAPAAPPK